MSDPCLPPIPFRTPATPCIKARQRAQPEANEHDYQAAMLRTQVASPKRSQTMSGMAHCKRLTYAIRRSLHRRQPTDCQGRARHPIRQCTRIDTTPHNDNRANMRPEPSAELRNALQQSATCTNLHPASGWADRLAGNLTAVCCGMPQRRRVPTWFKHQAYLQRHAGRLSRRRKA